jgi:transcriptional/translational regulatory protein YebC/TACO1
MLEHGKKISKDLSEFLKLYLTGDDLKNVSEELSNDGYKVTVSLLRMVLNRTNNITEDNNMRAIEELIVIAVRKRRKTNPKFNKILKDYSDIINRYKTK